MNYCFVYFIEDDDEDEEEEEEYEGVREICLKRNFMKFV